MASISWLGGAPATQWVETVTLTAYDVATTYKLTINGKTISTIGTGGTVTTTAAALVVLLNASTIPEFAEITWTNIAGQIIGTKDTAGQSFLFTKAVSGGTGTMGSTAATAGTGPNAVSSAANWSGGILPANGDDVTIGTPVSLLYDLDALSAVTLATLTILPSFTGTDPYTNLPVSIGLPKTNVSNPILPYAEYRPDYFQVSATIWTSGLGDGQGCGRIKLDNLTIQCTGTVWGSGQATDTNVPPILWKGTHASNAVTVMRGQFAAAFYAGEAATISVLTMGYVSSQSTDAQVRLSSGVTLATVNKNGGTLQLNGACTTLSQGPLTGAGTTTIYAGAITTVNLLGGKILANGTGTIGTLKLGSGATFDLSQGEGSITITTAKIYKGCTFNDPNGRFAGTLNFEQGVLNFSGDFNGTVGGNRSAQLGAATP